jgi:dipeptidase E
MAVRKQIIALGGGGFLMEPDNLALDRYILEQARGATPNVCFVPTASGDSESYISRYYESFETLDCHPSHLSLFHSPKQDLETYILQQDVIYVGGGNTRNLLAIWRDWGLDQILRRALDQGIVLTGVSAGSICWFQQGVTDSMKPQGSTRLASIDCLGFLPHSNCPHYDGEANRRPEYHRLQEAGEIANGWAADDGVGLHFMDGKLEAIVSSRPNACAYWVYPDGKGVQEEKMPPRYLA